MGSKKQGKKENIGERKMAVKAKIRALKAQRAKALEAKDEKKNALLRRRLHQQRRLVRKLAKQMKATATAA